MTKQDQITLFETPFWKVFLISDQAYLGWCVIYLKRECFEMSQIKNSEILDFQENIVKKIEPAFKKAFHAKMFNWACLMNNAYKNSPPNPQIHWHFRPRYDHAVEFEGENFEDLEFAHHYTKKRTKIVSVELLEKIAREVRPFL